MVTTPRIAAVSYLNTIPFIYGIQHEGSLRADLLLAPPAGCVDNYAEGRADIALIPAAAVPQMKSTNIITDYCVGASGPVRTVVVMSNSPIERVRRIFLDAHSRTSVQLTGYLAAKKWNIAPEWWTLSDYSLVAEARIDDAFLLIGDKVFDHEGLFAYTYDLAEEWKTLTGLPFACAQGYLLRAYRRTGAVAHAGRGVHLRGYRRERLRPQALRCLRLSDTQHRLHIQCRETRGAAKVLEFGHTHNAPIQPGLKGVTASATVTHGRGGDVSACRSLRPTRSSTRKP